MFQTTLKQKYTKYIFAFENIAIKIPLSYNDTSFCLILPTK